MAITPYAVVFPGQGSQKPGMGKSLYENDPVAKNIFEIISQATGVDVAKLCFESDEDTLRQTQNAQLALYTVGVSSYHCLSNQKNFPGPPIAMAGHSVGEYAALACAKIVSIEDGARLVQKRGDLMARAGALRKGAMSAILGLDDLTVETTTNQVSMDDAVVVVANYNCPGQLVISGDEPAVIIANEKLKTAGAKRCLPLNVSGAFHSPLMKEAEQPLKQAIDNTAFTISLEGISVISNVTADEENEPDRWKELMAQQLSSPVKWTQSVRKMHSLGAKLFLECGVGNVLCGLIKRIIDNAETISVEDVESIDKSIHAIRGENS